ncbi:hypothetical protein [Parabacteroides sp. Marseille-P3160]|uniref:hypothetical protein n=1 Tax=Parabacteroides sp. Marseille-P3160 TaxID=1917887 RepID=UPI0009BB6D16|nr:hypothetical protein [Parabacteroides sp. Marseille-P3160]
MSLETKSKELKNLVSAYPTDWFLGNLCQLMSFIANGMAQDQLGNLSSPLRQLYFLAGLHITSLPQKIKTQYTEEEWDKFVDLLNDIENEYSKLFFPEPDEVIDEEWKKVRSVAMPSFLSYFNQGPLNYEEQTINWIKDLFSHLDATIQKETGLTTDDFLTFYDNLDKLVQKNFESHSLGSAPLRKDWDKYTKLKMAIPEEVPEEIRNIGKEKEALYISVADHGIMNRFYAEELVSDNLTIDQVNKVLSLLSCKRDETDYLYYTSTKPGNPLYERPIISLDENMFQVFEIKQVIHSIEYLLESICSKEEKSKTAYIDRKGKLLETKIVDLFKLFFKDCEVYTGYYVDGCEQDILILWKEYAFIIEAKGYKLREPLRDPDKAFVRIKDDFKGCIEYAYTQTKRVEEKFVNQEPLKICDKDGNLIKEIDTQKYENNDFSIIVNLKSFGQIQNDLSTLLPVDKECSAYPWAVKLDDLETFLLMLIAKKKDPMSFINYLIMREELHGKLICSDELEICGGFISGKINDKVIEKNDKIVTMPDLANIFDEQYKKGLGFKNEKHWNEKQEGKTLFL